MNWVFSKTVFVRLKYHNWCRSCFCSYRALATDKNIMLLIISHYTLRHPFVMINNNKLFYSFKLIYYKQLIINILIFY